MKLSAACSGLVRRARSSALWSPGRGRLTNKAAPSVSTASASEKKNQASGGTRRFTAGSSREHDLRDLGEAGAAFGAADETRRRRQGVEMFAHVGDSGAQRKVGERRGVVAAVAD